MRIPCPRLYLATVTLIGGLAGIPVQAGVIDQHSANYVGIGVSALSSFQGGVEELGSFLQDFATAAPPDEPFGYRNTVNASTSAFPSRRVGDKATASGTISLTFSPGLGTADDTFAVTMEGLASAEGAIVSDGSPAQARVALSGTAQFYVDVGFGGAAAGEFVGTMTLPGLRAADRFESFSVKVFDVPAVGGAVPAGTLSPGGPGLLLGLYAGRGYTIAVDYEMIVPYSEDPPFSLSVQGSIAAVPEPASWALWAVGLAAAGGLASKRRRTA